MAKTTKISDSAGFCGWGAFLAQTVHELMTRDGQEVVPRFTLENNRPGTQALIEKVGQVMETDGFTELRLAAEATGWYWFHLFETLRNDPDLQAWPNELFLLNPRLTANFKKSYVDLDKSDPIDAYVIADRLRWGRDITTPNAISPTLPRMQNVCSALPEILTLCLTLCNRRSTWF